MNTYYVYAKGKKALWKRTIKKLHILLSIHLQHIQRKKSRRQCTHNMNNTHWLQARRTHRRKAGEKRTHRKTKQNAIKSRLHTQIYHRKNETTRAQIFLLQRDAPWYIMRGETKQRCCTTTSYQGKNANALE